MPDRSTPSPSQPAPQANRAARRGRPADQAPAVGGKLTQPRPAQGRRVNPVRRTG